MKRSAFAILQDERTYLVECNVGASSDHAADVYQKLIDSIDYAIITLRQGMLDDGRGLSTEDLPL